MIDQTKDGYVEFKMVRQRNNWSESKNEEIIIRIEEGLTLNDMQEAYYSFLKAMGYYVEDTREDEGE
jgi:hypothetical protein